MKDLYEKYAKISLKNNPANHIVKNISFINRSNSKTIISIEKNIINITYSIIKSLIKNKASQIEPSVIKSIHDLKASLIDSFRAIKSNIKTPSIVTTKSIIQRFNISLRRYITNFFFFFPSSYHL